MSVKLKSLREIAFLNTVTYFMGHSLFPLVFICSWTQGIFSDFYFELKCNQEKPNLWAKLQAYQCRKSVLRLEGSGGPVTWKQHWGPRRTAPHTISESWDIKEENRTTLSEAWRDSVFSGKSSASVCKKRDENFSGVSKNRGELADYRAQFRVNFGKWLKIGARESSLVKGREPTRATRYGYNGSLEEQLGQDRAKNRYWLNSWSKLLIL